MLSGHGAGHSGGAISNMYAVMVARHKMFPEYKEKGLKALPQLVLYTSEHVSQLSAFSFTVKLTWNKRLNSVIQLGSFRKYTFHTFVNHTKLTQLIIKFVSCHPFIHSHFSDYFQPSHSQLSQLSSWQCRVQNVSKMFQKCSNSHVFNHFLLQSHYSTKGAGATTGLGTDNVVEVPCDDRYDCWNFKWYSSKNTFPEVEWFLQNWKDWSRSGLKWATDLTL